MMNSQSLLGQAVVLEPARNADNVLQPLVDATTPLIIRAHSSTQTGALLRFEDSLGNLLASVDANGALTGAAAAPSGAVALAPATVTRNTITPSADTNAGLIILNHSPAQSAPLLTVGGPVDASVLQVPGVFGGANVSISTLANGQTGLQLYGFGPGQLGNLLECFPDPNGALKTWINGSGDLHVGSALAAEAGATPKIGFLGGGAVVKQVGASAAGIAAITDANAKAAITALQAALAAFTLVTSPA